MLRGGILLPRINNGKSSFFEMSATEPARVIPSVGVIWQRICEEMPRDVQSRNRRAFERGVVRVFVTRMFNHSFSIYFPGRRKCKPGLGHQPGHRRGGLQCLLWDRQPELSK